MSSNFNVTDKDGNVYKNLGLRMTAEKNDEYYTTYIHVEYVFNNYLKNVDFTDKIIYCFCDSEESNFVKYFKDNKDRLKYKDLWYTWDDYNNHKDLFEKADYVITNPPFSKMSGDLVPLINSCKKYFLWCSFFNLPSYWSRYGQKENFRLIDCVHNGISRPIEEKYLNSEREVRTAYMTNIPEVIEIKKKHIYTTKFADLENKVWCEQWGQRSKPETVIRKDILMIDKIKDIPIDYDGYIAVPISILFSHNIYICDIIDSRLEVGNNNICSDGRSRYHRVLIKIKPEFLAKN